MPSTPSTGARARAARGIAFATITALASGCVPSQVHYRPMAGDPQPLSGLEAVVYLVGDAGEDSPGRDVVLGGVADDLARLARESPETPASVVFLGDNIYDVGAREDFKPEDLAKLGAEVAVLDSARGARAIFLPGNHDWGKGAEDSSARSSIERQQQWLLELAPDTSARMLPADGCPGPTAVTVGGDVHLVLIDTEWLLRLPPDDCGGEAAFYARLTSTLSSLSDQRVVVASHHPIASGGRHGGNVAPFENGPLIYYLAVKSGLSVQDLASGRYTNMIAGLRGAIGASGTRPIAFAAGHDHSLQVIRMEGGDAPLFQLVSGSGSKSTRAIRIDGTRYASDANGFMRLDFARASTRAVVFAQDVPGHIRPVFSCQLTGPSGAPECAEATLVAEGG